MDVSVLIPAYNEEKTVAGTIEALASKKFRQIIVVDDGSSDETAAVAGKAGATVVRLPENLGKGAALNHGVKYVTGRLVCLLDADLGASAAEVDKLIWPVLTGQCQMAIAKFPPQRRKAGFGLVKKLAALGIKSYTGQTFMEPLSGQRALTREVLQQLLPFASGFGVEVLLTIKALKKGYRVLEVATDMTHAETGRDLPGFWHRGKQFLHVIRSLLMVRELGHE